MDPLWYFQQAIPRARPSAVSLCSLSTGLDSRAALRVRLTADPRDLTGYEERSFMPAMLPHVYQIMICIIFLEIPMAY